MARKLSTDIPELAVPEPIIERLESRREGRRGDRQRPHQRDPRLGRFDGIHLIPVAAYREMAARLAQRI